MNSKRNIKRLVALKLADEALYRLWKQSEVGSEEMTAINALQKQFVHPAIADLEQKVKFPKGHPYAKSPFAGWVDRVTK